METYKTTCPRCGAPAVIPETMASYECRYCGTVLDVHHSLCPFCSRLNTNQDRLCAHCGEAITRTCPDCGHLNWRGWETCAGCGTRLDLLTYMTQARVRHTGSRLQAQQDEALLIKQREAAQAEARMQQFWGIERQRQREVAERRTIQKNRERQMLTAVLLVVLAIIIIVAILTVGADLS